VAGEDLEEWMVSQGRALAYRHYSRDYVLQEAAAQAAQRGIWASEFVKPWEWRQGKRLGSAEPEGCQGCDVCTLRHKRLVKRQLEKDSNGPGSDIQ